MASTNITIFPSTIFFFIIILLCRNSSFAVADEETLIAVVCSKTTQPGYCRRCMNSFPIIKKDTVRDLAAVAIDCAIYRAFVVHNLLDRYSNSTHSPEVAQCGSIYGDLQKSLREAADSWLVYQYSKAQSLVVSAKSAHFSCYNLLVKAKWNIPVDLANEFYTFTAYDDVANNVLTQIK